MSNKIIIFATLGMLFISFVFLSFTEKKQADINSKNLWSVYFSDPKSNSLDFTIENHSTKSNFRWEIFAGKNKLQENDAAIKQGETKTIPVPAEYSGNKKITIDVTAGEEKKEIYKNL